MSASSATPSINSSKPNKKDENTRKKQQHSSYDISNMQKKLRARDCQRRENFKKIECEQHVEWTNHSYHSEYWTDRQTSWSNKNLSDAASNQRDLFLINQKELRKETIDSDKKEDVITSKNKDCSRPSGKVNSQGSHDLKTLKNSLSDFFKKQSEPSCVLPLFRLENKGNYCYSNCIVTVLLANPIVNNFINTETSRKGGLLQDLRRLCQTPISKVWKSTLNDCNDFVCLSPHPV